MHLHWPHLWIPWADATVVLGTCSFMKWLILDSDFDDNKRFVNRGLSISSVNEGANPPSFQLTVLPNPGESDENHGQYCIPALSRCIGSSFSCEFSSLLASSRSCICSIAPPVSVVLSVTYTPEYPNEKPTIEVVSEKGLGGKKKKEVQDLVDSKASPLLRVDSAAFFAHFCSRHLSSAFPRSGVAHRSKQCFAFCCCGSLAASSFVICSHATRNCLPFWPPLHV